MSSALESALIYLVQSNYLTVISITVMAYDYVLTFPDEVEYIWMQPWTWVTVLFIVVRYVGLCGFIIPPLIGSTFVPGPVQLYVLVLPSFLPKFNNSVQFASIKQFRLMPVISQGRIIVLISGWAHIPFLAAAELVMILRVWAMYNQSRVILVALLLVFFPEIILFIVNIGDVSAHMSNTASTFQILNLSLCLEQNINSIWSKVANILQVIHGSLLCMFAIWQFMVQSVQMYRVPVAKRWKLNRYMNLMAREAVIYFLSALFPSIMVILYYGRNPPGKYLTLAGYFLEIVPPCILTPRFIINIRALHARDIQERRGEGIDTGFGLSVTLSGHDAGAWMNLADIGNLEESVGLEEISRVG